MRKGGGCFIVLLIRGKPAYKQVDYLYEELVIKGKSYTQLAGESDCSMEVVRRHANQFGLKRSASWKDIVEQCDDIIRELHDCRFNINAIAYWIGCHPDTLEVAMKEIGLINPIKNDRVSEDVCVKSSYRKYNLNYNYFKVWTPEMAYIVGFINADGTLYKPKGRNNYTLKISQKRESKEILEKIKNAIQYEGPVKDYMAKAQSGIYPYSELTINSGELASDLMKLGIVPNKSLIKKMPVSLPEEFELDYIRGYFDGNGSVGKQYPTNSKGERTETCQIRVRIHTGSEIHAEQLQETLQKYGLKRKKVSGNKKKTLFEICYSTKESLMLYDLLYKDNDSMRMDRKYKAFTEYVEQRQKDIVNKERN